MSSTNIWWTPLVFPCKWLHCDLWPFPQVSDPGPSGPSCLIMYLKIYIFIKVDFTTIRVVTEIATQGRTAGYTVNDQYVTTFRLLYSENCVNFTVYKDTVGNEKVHLFNSWYNSQFGIVLMQVIDCTKAVNQHFLGAQF